VRRRGAFRNSVEVYRLAKFLHYLIQKALNLREEVPKDEIEAFDEADELVVQMEPRCGWYSVLMTMLGGHVGPEN